MPRYKVMVNDNFHYQDEDERWEQGVYDTLEEALAACRGLVDRSIEEALRPGVTAEALFDHYRSFGDDPFILVMGGTDEVAGFSAWTYAEARCRQLRPAPSDR